MSKSSPRPSSASRRPPERTAEDALAFIESASFPWHQRFQLVPGVYTPGRTNTEALIERLSLPPDLTGASVLDVGANNGGVSFELERRGAERVVAVDIFPADRFGFAELRSFLGSKTEYIQSSVYDLGVRLQERFDIVLFLGVLYHLRHPLLALDVVRSLTRSVAFIETAVADYALGDRAELPIARFYRKDELNNDPTNWFQPTVRCLLDWCRSAGLEPKVMTPARQAPKRCLVRCAPVPGDPEYALVSYERPVRVMVDLARKPDMGPSLLADLERYVAAFDAPSPPFPIPPADLIDRVTGKRDEHWFDRTGGVSVKEYQGALAAIGRSLETASAIYDFGCGCGRVLRWLLETVPAARLHASDVDAEAVAWVRDRLPDVDARTTGPLPPLPWADGAFDIVLGHSVFTHLNEAYQDVWLAELHRVTRPGAALLLSVHGWANWEHTRATFPKLASSPGVDRMADELRRRGFLHWTGEGWETKGLPDYYHTTWHLPTYLHERWGRWFHIVRIDLGGAIVVQDLVTLLRRDRPHAAVPSTTQGPHSELASSRDSVSLAVESGKADGLADVVPSSPQDQTGERRGNFANGIATHPILPRLYAELDAATRVRFGDPPRGDGPETFFAWATAPRPEGVAAGNRGS